MCYGPAGIAPLCGSPSCSPRLLAFIADKPDETATLLVLPSQAVHYLLRIHRLVEQHSINSLFEVGLSEGSLSWPRLLAMSRTALKLASQEVLGSG